MRCCCLLGMACASAVAASVAGPVVAAWLPAVSLLVASKGVALLIGVLFPPADPGGQQSRA